MSPEEPDPTAEPEVGCLGLLKLVLYVLVFALLAGKFITGSFLWEHELPNFKKWIPVRRPRPLPPSFPLLSLTSVRSLAPPAPAAMCIACTGCLLDARRPLRPISGSSPNACYRRLMARTTRSQYILPYVHLTRHPGCSGSLTAARRSMATCTT